MSESGILKPGYRKGVPPPNKGKKLPAEVLTAAELDSLMAALPPTGKIGPRNRAMVALMARAGLKIGQVVALQPHHYREGEYVITVPGGKASKERTAALDPQTRGLLMRWLEIRHSLPRVPKLAPLFISVSKGSIGSPIWDAYVREMLTEAAQKAGIRKRVTPSGLKATFDSGVTDQSRRIVSQLATHIDEHRFELRYPTAHRRWTTAFSLYEQGAWQYVDAIENECRAAMIAFATELTGTTVPTEDAIKVTVDAYVSSQPFSKGVRALVKSLTACWQAVYDLSVEDRSSQLPLHEAEASKDSRRLVFQTLNAMIELDHAVGSNRRLAAGDT